MTVESEFNSILLPDERLLWSGRPKRVSRIAIGYGLLMLVLFGVLLTPLSQAAITGDMSVFERVNFSINGEQVTAETPISEIYSSVILIVSMLVFFIVLIGVWLFSSLQKTFLLTDRRVLIQSGFPVKKVTNIQLANVFLTERSGAEKIGTITLFPSKPDLLSRIMRLYQVPENSLTNIENPQAVETMILSAVAQLRKEQSK